MAKIGVFKPFRGSWNGMKDIILEDGEIAFDTTNKRIYMGNGSDSISELNPFINNGNTDISDIGSGSITSAINTINEKMGVTNKTYYVGTWIYNYGQTKALLYVPCNVTIHIQLSNIAGGIILVNSYGTVPVTSVETFKNGVLLGTNESYDSMKNMFAYTEFTGL